MSVNFLREKAELTDLFWVLLLDSNEIIYSNHFNVKDFFFSLWEFHFVKDKKLQKPHSAVFLYKVTDMQRGYFKLVARLLFRDRIAELAQDYGNSNEDCITPYCKFALFMA